jgi:hypothetical protein
VERGWNDFYGVAKEVSFKKLKLNQIDTGGTICGTMVERLVERLVER